MPLYLGLDSSTQSLTAIIIEIERGVRRVVFESSLSFDEALPHYGIASRRAAARGSPRGRFVAADVGGSPRSDDRRESRRAASISRRLAAVSGSAQQHGSVYLNATWTTSARGARSASADRRSDSRRCSRAGSRPSGWTRARRRSARKSLLPSVGKRYLPGGRARARSSGSPALRSDGSTSSLRTPIPQRPAYTWSARSWRRCSPGSMPPSIPETVQA